MMKNNPLRHLQREQRVALVTHLHPDGDAYGSMLGMLHILRENHYVAQCFAYKDPCSKFSFLPSFDEMVTKDELADQHYDVCIVLDCGSEERVGEFSALLSISDLVINLDHHVSNTGFGDIQWVDPAASSTSEMVARLAEDMSLVINFQAATCLLAGIMMDTGNFLYDSTTAQTHLTAALLLQMGADKASIRERLFQSRPLGNVRFMGHLIEEMEFLMDNQIVLLTVSEDMLKTYQVAYEDLDEYISYVRDIAGVELAVIFKEISTTQTKVSFRSKRWCDVNALAAKLEGGGHERAAGATISGTMQQAKEILVPLVVEAVRKGQ